MVIPWVNNRVSKVVSVKRNVTSVVMTLLVFFVCGGFGLCLMSGNGGSPSRQVGTNQLQRDKIA